MEKRFFVESIDSDIITLSGEEFEHMSRVLRCKVGERVECFSDGSDIFVCKILSINKNQAILQVESKYTCKANPKVQVAVFQALVKGDKLEFLTMKLSELGVGELVLFSSRFTNFKPNMVRPERLNKIAVGASKQCGRTSIMKIGSPIKFEQVLQELKNYDTIIFANETEKDTEKTLKNAKKPQFDGKIAIIIGSEGGFEIGEIESIIKAGGVSTSLGSRILRAETAAIALTSIVMYQVGEL